jgi:hypothetical protein
MLEMCATKGAAPAPFSDMRTSGVPDFIFSAIGIAHYIAERQVPARKAASQRTSAHKQKPDPTRLTLGPAIKQFPALDALNFDANHVRHAPVAAVHQHDMPTDDVIGKVRRRWRQSAIKINRNRMQSRAPTSIEHQSGLQTGRPIWRQPVLDAESKDRMCAMFSPPSVHNYVLVIVKRRMFPIPLMVVALLRKRISSNKNQHRSGNQRS